LNVRAGDEGFLARARDNSGANTRLGADALEGIVQFRNHLGRKRIALFRAVHRHQRDACVIRFKKQAAVGHYGSV
jgi:hypothetical protein